jgi:hypothetical protein
MLASGLPRIKGEICESSYKIAQRVPPAGTAGGYSGGARSVRAASICSDDPMSSTRSPG